MENFEAQHQTEQDQTEQVEQENGLENTWNNIAELKNNYEESKRRLNENWEKIVEQNEPLKKFLEKYKKHFEKAKEEVNYLILNNTDEIKVPLFWVDPVYIVLAVNNTKYTDNKRIKQVIKALKEPGDAVDGGWCKSIQDLQKLMWDTLGITLDQNWKFWVETFSAMKRYLSGETATAN